MTPILVATAPNSDEYHKEMHSSIRLLTVIFNGFSGWNIYCIKDTSSLRQKSQKRLLRVKTDPDVQVGIQTEKTECLSLIYRVWNYLRPPLHNLKYKYLRKSAHIASKYHQCRTPVENFMNLSQYFVPKNDYSIGHVWNVKIR